VPPPATSAATARRPSYAVAAVVGAVAHFGGAGLGTDARQVRDAGGRDAAARGGAHHLLEAWAVAAKMGSSSAEVCD